MKNNYKQLTKDVEIIIIVVENGVKGVTLWALPETRLATKNI